MSPLQIRLRELRQAKGLTQVQLAELCGMPQSTISRIESGSTTGVDFDTLERVAEALGVHPSELIVYGKIPFEHRGRSYVIADMTAQAESIPAGATAVWGIEGEEIVFAANAGDQPGNLIKSAKRLLDQQG